MSRRRTRLLIAVTLAAALLLLYAGSYVALKRASLAVLRDYDNMGFWYVPVEPRTMRYSPALRSLHRVLDKLYHPAWLIDHHLTGAVPPDEVEMIDDTRD